jgi:hypothetical protein
MVYDEGTQNQQYVTKYTSTVVIEVFLWVKKVLNKRPFANAFRYPPNRVRPPGTIDPKRTWGLITNSIGISWITPHYDRMLTVDFTKKKSLYYRKRKWR